MKSALIHILMLVIPCVGLAEWDESFKRAILQGAEAKVVCRVVDDEGMPVSSATVHVWFSSYGRHQDDADWVVETDTNGVFIASHRTNEQLSWLVSKKGYYQTHGKILFRDRKVEGSKVVDGKWQPYGETRTVVLKKIKNPYAVKVFSGEQCHRKIPSFGQWLSFDMEQSDWLAPYGKGVHNDVLLRFHKKLTDKWYDFAFSMEACFTNSPYAGVYVRPLDEYSDLKSSYFAETNATYCTNYNFSFESVSKKRAGLEENSYLVFRTRTRVDENGKLVGAHYGKYSRGWRSDDKEMHFGAACFNPVENDPNIEGDQTLHYAIRNYKNKK